MISTLDIQSACMQIEFGFQESVYVIHLYHILPQNILGLLWRSGCKNVICIISITNQTSSNHNSFMYTVSKMNGI